MNGLLQDLRYTLRTFAKTPAFTAVVVVTLALGIGANTAIFSVVRGVLLKSLPYRDPDRLVRIGHVRPEGARLGDSFSPQDFDDLAREQPGLSNAAAYQFVSGLTVMNLLGKGEPISVSACFASASFFETLGVAAASGRTLLPAENTPGRDGVAVVSERLRTRLSGAGGLAAGSTLVAEDEGQWPPTGRIRAGAEGFRGGVTGNQRLHGVEHRRWRGGRRSKMYTIFWLRCRKLNAICPGNQRRDP